MHNYVIGQTLQFLYQINFTVKCTCHVFLKDLTPKHETAVHKLLLHIPREQFVLFMGSVYREALISLSVQRLLALNPSCFIIYFEEVLRLLVDPRALQLVDHLSSENLVRFDLQAEEWKLLKTHGKNLTSQMCVRNRSSG